MTFFLTYALSLSLLYCLLTAAAVWAPIRMLTPLGFILLLEANMVVSTIIWVPLGGGAWPFSLGNEAASGLFLLADITLLRRGRLESRKIFSESAFYYVIFTLFLSTNLYLFSRTTENSSMLLATLLASSLAYLSALFWDIFFLSKLLRRSWGLVLASSFSSLSASFIDSCVFSLIFFSFFRGETLYTSLLLTLSTFILRSLSALYGSFFVAIASRLGSWRLRLS